MSLFIDLETSGLSPAHGAAILSIGMISDGGERDTVTDTLEIYVIPTPEQWAQANPQALEVNGLTMDFLLNNGLHLPCAIEKVCEWLTKQRVWLGTTVVGQNPDFDYRFLRSFMGHELQLVGFPVDRNAVNVIDMARELVTKDKTFRVPNYKGASISLALGLPPEPPIHQALAGAAACRQNYYALEERLRKCRRF